METKPPTVGRILIAVGFAISCFALALFLWLAFGGQIPLKPESYRVTVPFQEATQLAVESDVRISGVAVGKVKRVDLNDEGYAEATVEIDARYAPIPSDTRAILRQKTLLGETYVELSAGSQESEPLPEDGTLPRAQVSDAVQLDEIFRAFDDETRANFQAWMRGQAAAFRGRGADFSAAIASLDPFAREADRALRLLDSQSEAVSGLLRSGGEVFGALSERPGQLRGLITNANTVFETTARRNEDLATAFEIFPTFLRESRATLARLETFAADSDPVVQALQPTARELAPTVTSLARLSADDERLGGAALGEAPFALERLHEARTVVQPGEGVGALGVAQALAEAAQVGAPFDALPLVGEKAPRNGDQVEVRALEDVGSGRERADRDRAAAGARLEGHRQVAANRQRGQGLAIEQSVARVLAVRGDGKDGTGRKLASNLAADVDQAVLAVLPVNVAHQDRAAGEGGLEQLEHGVSSLGEACKPSLGEPSERAQRWCAHVFGIGRLAGNVSARCKEATTPRVILSVPPCFSTP